MILNILTFMSLLFFDKNWSSIFQKSSQFVPEMNWYFGEMFLENARNFGMKLTNENFHINIL